MRKLTDKIVSRVDLEAQRASPEVMRKFLKKRVGRKLLSVLLGGSALPNQRRADAYLYQAVALSESEMLKIEECYRAARIIDELRRRCSDFDDNLARNWLMLPCYHLSDVAPICVIRDGRSINHLSAVGAAKTFVLR